MIKSSPTKYNTSMLILQCIGIIAVVLGHADIGGDDIPNLLNLAFPYYSWHMPFFMFISGYFFNRVDTIGKYTFKKLKTHLLPAFIVNAVCGIFSMCIKHFSLTSYGQDITIKSLFITPFTTGYQFYINVSLWFVFALVVIEVIACFMDRVTKGKAELVFLVITFVTSLYCCFMAYYDHQGTRGEYYNAALRLGYLMFFFWLGICYRSCGEKYLKRFLNYKVSLAIFAIVSIVLGLTKYKIVTNVRDMQMNSITVPNGYWVAVVSPIIATIFFLGIAYSLAPYFKNSKAIVKLGRGTRYIMYYHQLMFVLFSLVLGALIKLSVINIEGFSFEKMAKSAYYTGGNIALTCVLSIISIVLPITFCDWIAKQKKVVSVVIYTVLTVLVVLLLYLCSLVM